MQVKKKDGTFGEPMPYSQNKLNKALSDPDTEHVEVFEATPEQMKFRNLLSVKKRFKKTGGNKKGK